MGKPSKADAPRSPGSLALFAPDPAVELERAKQIVKAFPLDARFEQLNNGRPYWRALWSRQGKRYRKYVGGVDDVEDVKRAHELVRKYLAAQGIEVPRSRPKKETRSTRAPTARPQKPKGARGGRLSTSVATLRDSAATEHAAGDRRPVAANGSRRRS